MNARDDFGKTVNLFTASSSAGHLNNQDLFGALTTTSAATASNNNYLNQGQSDALTSLFKSLSNLAKEQNKQSLEQQHLMQDIKPANLSVRHNHIDPPVQTPHPSPMMGSSLATSIQSAVAAALMQQQFSASIDPQQQHRQQQQRQQASRPTSASALPPPLVPNFINSTTPIASSTSTTFLNEQLRNNFNLFSQSSKNLDQNLQSTLTQQMFQSPFNGHINPQGNRQQTRQQQQRINYCTICDKELCNKYFMKTHMLKMHGINLEIEHSVDNDSNQSGTDDTAKESGDTKSNETRESDTEQSGENSCMKSSNKNASPPSNAGKKQSSAIKQTTSVMNGFAGNSMGGVVCDICNKELCSKYFLKVHKQNTHGIMTDYSDTSQFMYPFANPLTAAPYPFNSLAAASMGLTQAQSSMMMFGIRGDGPQHMGTAKDHSTRSGNHSGKKSSKKARLMKTQQTIGGELADGGSESQQQQPQQIDAFYRLMLARQQANSEKDQTNLLPASPATGQSIPPFAPLDPMAVAATNPMSALMCFGGMTPFGPTGMSPALVVDMILRNQHLFNRKNLHNTDNNQSQNEQAVEKSLSKDKNNTKSDNDPKQKGSKNAKDNAANNSRYFSHYTEACPMCDRRFKSIKWLKTHMMNDHKQEIGAYMQMMMQYLYSNKSQPVTHMTGNFAAPVSQQNFSITTQQDMAQSHLVNQQNLHNPFQTNIQPPPKKCNQEMSPTSFMLGYLNQNHENTSMRNTILQNSSNSSNSSECYSASDEIENLTTSNCHFTALEVQSMSFSNQVLKEDKANNSGHSSPIGEQTDELDLSLSGNLLKLGDSTNVGTSSLSELTSDKITDDSGSSSNIEFSVERHKNEDRSSTNGPVFRGDGKHKNEFEKDGMAGESRDSNFNIE